MLVEHAHEVDLVIWTITEICVSTAVVQSEAIFQTEPVFLNCTLDILSYYLI